MSMYYLLMILVGFVVGYFFATPVLIILTVMVIGYGISLWIRCKEMAVMIAMAYTACGFVTIAAMWITHYSVTKQTWIGDFVKHYVLR